MSKNYPFYKQLDAIDCGVSCLRMVAKYYDRYFSIETLRELAYTDKEGVSLLGISDAAEQIGFKTLGAKIDFQKLENKVPLPAIAYWEQSHFVVVYKVTSTTVTIGDPKIGIRTMSKTEFLNGWESDIVKGVGHGIVLLLETTPDFLAISSEKTEKNGFGYLLFYIKKYKKLLFQLFLGLFIGSIIQLLFPFLLKEIIDRGILNGDYSFIAIVIGIQFFFVVAQIGIEIIRNSILLYIGSRVNVSLMSDFLLKLSKMPIRYFDTKMTGDFIQRIYDNKRIEHFLTSTSLNTLFSAVSLFIFSVVLLIFSWKIFLIYSISVILYILWVFVFLKKRRGIDFKRFDQSTEAQNMLIQFINGMQDIKLHNSENMHRWNWERVQAKLFRIDEESLMNQQWERAGTRVINESKTLITFLIGAHLVISGNITIGTLMAIVYIIGLLNSPLESLMGFMHNLQDAKLSLERLSEIHHADEPNNELESINMIPRDRGLMMENVFFQYGGLHSKMVLRNIDLIIPKGKVTAIVGASGSGKTTILKLLMGMYRPTNGVVKFGDHNLNQINTKIWRDKIGSVLQDSYIFSDTIAKNIALGEEIIDKEKLLLAVKIAHIHDYIESLPLGYNTRIGMDGLGFSQGQKQRILIARAIYKSPEYFFFDEATNALDASTEKIVMQKILNMFIDKTVVIVAHRLNTVKNADNIIVINDGEIIEQGRHRDLIKRNGLYYDLIKNQLDLV